MRSFLLITFSLLPIIARESEPCTLTTGINGKCISIQECDYAISLLQRGQRPEICGFDGNNPRVCCPELVSNAGGRKPGELSDLKCQEYYSYFGITVFGGEVSKAKEFPHMALIGFKGDDGEIKWLCGGSLISPTFVLTAAHCLNSFTYGSPKHVRLGDLDLSTDTDEADPQQFTIKRSIPHPRYEPPSKYHDIGLVELDRPINKTEYVSMACLLTERQHEENVMLATGWGKVEFQGDSSNILLKANLTIAPHDKCQAAYKSSNKLLLARGIVDDMMICAGDNQTDTCQGDSGGPLQLPNRVVRTKIKVYNIIGVTSFGKVCGISNSPGVYTRVFHYLDWIEKTAWPNE
nr:venom protease-like [Leptinotarsa decemlineata]